MKNNLHPKLSKLTIVLTDGSVRETLWTGKETEIKLNMDPHNHPAWTGNFGVNIQAGRAAKFLSRYK